MLKQKKYSAMNAILNSQLSGDKDIQECGIPPRYSLQAHGSMITASRLRVRNEDYSIFSIFYNTFIIQLPDTEYNLMAGYFIF